MRRIFAVRSVLHLAEYKPLHYQIAGQFSAAPPNMETESSLLVALVLAHLTPSQYRSRSIPTQPDKEIGVTSKHLRHIAFIGALTLALSTNAEADKLKQQVDTDLTLAIVGVAAVVTVVVVAVHQATVNRTITGCVNAAPNGITVSDGKNKRIYVLTGDTAGVKPGDRMTLRLKRIKSKGNNDLTWETKRVLKDLGACQP